MKNYGHELFKGTASYYSAYRPLYPSELVRWIVNRFSLDGQGNMLDLGCGTGQLMMRFSDWFERLVGVDSEQEMIGEALRRSEEARIDNIKWITADAESYLQNTNEIFRVVTIAKAFHWMDRKAVLDDLYNKIQLDGGVAIIDHYAPHKEPLPWQAELQKIIKLWYGEERRAGNTTYSHPQISHEEIVAQSRFELEVHRLPTYEQQWTIQSIIGNLYSTSYGSRRFLGDRAASFEQELEKALLRIDNSGFFTEEIDLSIILAMKR